MNDITPEQTERRGHVVVPQSASSKALLGGLTACRKLDELLDRLYTEGKIAEGEMTAFTTDVREAKNALLRCVDSVEALREIASEYMSEAARTAASRFYGTLSEAEQGSIRLEAIDKGFQCPVAYLRHINDASERQEENPDEA